MFRATSERGLLASGRDVPLPEESLGRLERTLEEFEEG